MHYRYLGINYAQTIFCVERKKTIFLNINYIVAGTFLYVFPSWMGVVEVILPGQFSLFSSRKCLDHNHKAVVDFRTEKRESMAGLLLLLSCLSPAVNSCCWQQQRAWKGEYIYNIYLFSDVYRSRVRVVRYIFIQWCGSAFVFIQCRIQLKPIGTYLFGSSFVFCGSVS